MASNNQDDKKCQPIFSDKGVHLFGYNVQWWIVIVLVVFVVYVLYQQNMLAELGFPKSGRGQMSSVQSGGTVMRLSSLNQLGGNLSLPLDSPYNTYAY